MAIFYSFTFKMIYDRGNMKKENYLRYLVAIFY